MGTKQKVLKMGQKGRDQGHVTYFWILQHIITGQDEATKKKFCWGIEGNWYKIK